LSSDTLTEKILYAMGTGTWVAGQTGVSQVLDRTNLMSTYAHLRRVKSPLAKNTPTLGLETFTEHSGVRYALQNLQKAREVGLTNIFTMMGQR